MITSRLCIVAMQCSFLFLRKCFVICYEELALVGLGVVDELDDRVFEHFWVGFLGYLDENGSSNRFVA